MHAGRSYSEAPSALQRLVDEVFEDGGQGLVSTMDLLTRVQIDDIDGDPLEVVELLPAGRYTRSRLCDQLNSIITAHGWGMTLGTVH